MGNIVIDSKLGKALNVKLNRIEENKLKSIHKADEAGQ